MQRRERKHQYNSVSTEVTIAQVLHLGAVEQDTSVSAPQANRVLLGLPLEISRK